MDDDPTETRRAELARPEGKIADPQAELAAVHLRDYRDSYGLILVNGECGERLLEQAQRWKLSFRVIRSGWGEPFDWEHVRQAATYSRPNWIWAVLSETSAAVENSLSQLRAISCLIGADLCLDASGAAGIEPLPRTGAIEFPATTARRSA